VERHRLPDEPPADEPLPIDTLPLLPVLTEAEETVTDPLSEP
jgi:hypothetical protein